MFGVIASIFRPRSLRSHLAERGWHTHAAERHPLVGPRTERATWGRRCGTAQAPGGSGAPYDGGDSGVGRNPTNTTNTDFHPLPANDQRNPALTPPSGTRFVGLRSEPATWRGVVGSRGGSTWTLWRAYDGTDVSCFTKGQEGDLQSL
jgi:hypothetical protein